jgi:hypothetical protein
MLSVSNSFQGTTEWSAKRVWQGTRSQDNKDENNRPEWEQLSKWFQPTDAIRGVKLKASVQVKYGTDHSTYLTTNPRR